MDRPAVAADSGKSLLTAEEEAGTAVSGEVEVAGCFSSGLSIFRCLVFITRPLRPAPGTISRRSWGKRNLLFPLTRNEIHRTLRFVARQCGSFLVRRQDSEIKHCFDY